MDRGQLLHQFPELHHGVDRLAIVWHEGQELLGIDRRAAPAGGIRGIELGNSPEHRIDNAVILVADHADRQRDAGFFRCFPENTDHAGDRIRV